MYRPNNLGGVALGKQSVDPSALHMGVLAFARLTEPRRKRAVETRYLPGLSDGIALDLAMLSNETIHAPIEDGELKAKFVEETGNTLLSPISTVTRPFDET